MSMTVAEWLAEVAAKGDRQAITRAVRHLKRMLDDLDEDGTDYDAPDPEEGLLLEEF